MVGETGAPPAQHHLENHKAPGFLGNTNTDPTPTLKSQIYIVE